MNKSHTLLSRIIDNPHDTETIIEASNYLASLGGAVTVKEILFDIANQLPAGDARIDVLEKICKLK